MFVRDMFVLVCALLLGVLVLIPAVTLAQQARQEREAAAARAAMEEACRLEAARKAEAKAAADAEKSRAEAAKKAEQERKAQERAAAIRAKEEEKARKRAERSTPRGSSPNTGSAHCRPQKSWKPSAPPIHSPPPWPRS